MQDKLCTYLTKTNSFNLIGFYSSLYVGPLKVINSHIANEKISLLLLFVIIKFKNWATHIDDFYILQQLHPSLNCLTIDF